MDDQLMERLLQKRQISDLQAVQECNSYTGKFGLVLSDKEALELLRRRREVLKEEERFEMQGGILPKLIYEFCDSPYIYQNNYVETIDELQRIFYLYKNESQDELSDDELIAYMKTYFDEECGGSLDYLEETSLYELCQNRRTGYQNRDMEDMHGHKDESI